MGKGSARIDRPNSGEWRKMEQPRRGQGTSTFLVPTLRVGTHVPTLCVAAPREYHKFAAGSGRRASGLGFPRGAWEPGHVSLQEHESAQVPGLAGVPPGKGRVVPGLTKEANHAE